MHAMVDLVQSEEEIQCYLDSNGFVYSPYYLLDMVERDDVSMISIVKQLGVRASGKFADIKIKSFK